MASRSISTSINCNLHQIGLNPTQYVKDNHKKYGDMFEIWVGSIDQVYATNSKTKFFSKGTVKHINGDGLTFNNDLTTWKRNRKFVILSINSPRFLRDFTQLVQSLFNENESYWDKKEYEIDFAVWIKCLTTDIVLQTVTRKPSYCLNTYLFGEINMIRLDLKKSKVPLNLLKPHKHFFELYFQAFIPEIFKNYVPGILSFEQKLQREL